MILIIFLTRQLIKPKFLSAVPIIIKNILAIRVEYFCFSGKENLYYQKKIKPNNSFYFFTTYHIEKLFQNIIF